MQRTIGWMIAMALAVMLVFSLGPLIGSAAGGKKSSNPRAAKKVNPCNPCAAKQMNPCNPCAAKAKNPCNPCAAKMNPCAAKTSQGPVAKARMIVGQVISADANRLAVRWKDQTLQIGVHSKTQFTRGQEDASVASIVPGEPITVSTLDQGGNLSANYVYLAQAKAGNPCNPCAAKKNPCNPCAAKKNPCNPCAAKKSPGNPCGAKR